MSGTQIVKAFNQKGSGIVGFDQLTEHGPVKKLYRVIGIHVEDP